MGFKQTKFLKSRISSSKDVEANNMLSKAKTGWESHWPKSPMKEKLKISSSSCQLLVGDKVHPAVGKKLGSGLEKAGAKHNSSM